MAKKTTLDELIQYVRSHYSSDRGTREFVRDKFRIHLGMKMATTSDKTLPEFDFEEFDSMFKDYLWWHRFIRFGNTTGCYDVIIDGSYRRIAHDTGPDRDLVVFNDFRIPESYPGVREATGEETEELLRKCYRNGRMYDGFAFMHVQQVRVGDWIVPGAWPNADANDPGSIVVGVSGEEATVIDIEPESFQPEIVTRTVELWREPYVIMSASRRKAAMSRMSEYGLAYDQDKLVFVSSTPRADLNGTYWYITDNFTIRAESDRRTPAHSRRYVAGNYFLTPEEAQEFLSKVLGLLPKNRRLPSDV